MQAAGQASGEVVRRTISMDDHQEFRQAIRAFMWNDCFRHKMAEGDVASREVQREFRLHRWRPSEQYGGLGILDVRYGVLASNEIGATRLQDLSPRCTTTFSPAMLASRCARIGRWHRAMSALVLWERFEGVDSGLKRNKVADCGHRIKLFLHALQASARNLTRTSRSRCIGVARHVVTPASHPFWLRTSTWAIRQPDTTTPWRRT